MNDNYFLWFPMFMLLIMTLKNNADYKPVYGIKEKPSKECLMELSSKKCPENYYCEWKNPNGYVEWYITREAFPPNIDCLLNRQP